MDGVTIYAREIQIDSEFGKIREFLIKPVNIVLLAQRHALFNFQRSVEFNLSSQSCETLDL